MKALDNLDKGALGIQAPLRCKAVKPVASRRHMAHLLPVDPLEKSGGLDVSHTLKAPDQTGSCIKTPSF